MSAPTTPSADAIELVTPLGRAWEPVVRLVLGGIADRADLGFEELDDLQLAVERLLAEAGEEGAVTIWFELAASGVRARVGPLRQGPIARALQDSAPRRGELGLRRILETVVDAYGVEHCGDGHLVVRLEKAVRG